MKIFLKALKKSLAKPRTFVLCYFATVQYYMERNGTVMLKIIDDFVWGVPLIVLILAVGIFLTIRLRGLQITKLPLAVRHIIANEKDGKDGEVSSFGALCTALSATIGTGNIVGVATAVVAGGPGTLFWMWIGGAVWHGDQVCGMSFGDQVPRGGSGWTCGRRTVLLY